MRNRTEQFNDGPKADGSDARSRHPDHLWEVPRVRLSGNQTAIEGGDEQKQRLQRRLGLNNKQLDALLSRLAQATTREGRMDEGELNLMVGLIWDHKPETQMELHVLSQAAIATVMAARGAHYVGASDTLPQQDSGERLFSKSNRTYAMLMELFYRTRLQRRHLAELEGPQGSQPELLALTDQRAVPMPPIPTADAVALATSSQLERP
jgi:hypothetical protein